jgi:succinate dehydrogenase / fumarate reductase cytochrome b subunit
MTLYRSTIGKKAIMALTGFVLVGFVVFHMYGNLKMYSGADEFNAYAAGLRTIGYPIFPYEQLLWIARIILLGAVVLHIWSAYQLTIHSRASTMSSRVSGNARYGQKKTLQASYASLTMRYGGVILLLFILFHLAHLTFGWVGYGPGQFAHPEGTEYSTYQNVVVGFQNPLVSIFYIAAMLALGAHLYHGVWSMFQTLGWNNRNWTKVWRGLAVLIAVIVVLGNISFPIAVMAGIVA